MSIQQLMFDKLKVFIDPTTGAPYVDTWGASPSAMDILYMGNSLEDANVATTNLVYEILENLLMMSLISENITIKDLLDSARLTHQKIDTEEHPPEPVVS